MYIFKIKTKHYYNIYTHISLFFSLTIYKVNMTTTVANTALNTVDF